MAHIYYTISKLMQLLIYLRQLTLYPNPAYGRVCCKGFYIVSECPDNQKHAPVDHIHHIYLLSGSKVNATSILVLGIIILRITPP